MTPTPTFTPTPTGVVDILVNSTPFGALGWAMAFALFAAAVVLSIGTIVLLWGAIFSKNEAVSRRLADAIKTASKIFCSKIRQIRPTAITFGVLLTTITIVLLQVVDLANAKEAFWLALGVVLGTFANAITKLTEGSDEDQREPNNK